MEEFDLPLRVSIPNLPNFSIQDHIETFFVKFWPLIPVIDRKFVAAEFTDFIASSSRIPGASVKS